MKSILALFLFMFSLKQVHAESNCEGYFLLLEKRNQPLSADPLSNRFINTSSAEFQAEQKAARAGETVKDRLTGETLTKKEMYERQKMALSNPARLSEDPVTGLPIDLKSPVYKINKDIRTVANQKFVTGNKNEPWKWLVQPPQPANVKESINFVVSDYLAKNTKRYEAINVLKEVSVKHNVPLKNVLEDSFRNVRIKLKELEAQKDTPAGAAYIKQLEDIDVGIQIELKTIYASKK